MINIICFAVCMTYLRVLITQLQAKFMNSDPSSSKVLVSRLNTKQHSQKIFKILATQKMAPNLNLDIKKKTLNCIGMTPQTSPMWC